MKKSKNYRNSVKSISTENGKPVTNLDSNLDTFELQRKVMKAGSKNSKDPRAKETAAMNQALYIARKFKDTHAYNSTVKDIIAETKVTKLVQQDKDAPTYSGRHAFNFTFGNDENIKSNIVKELDAKPSKRRRIELNKQLRVVNNRIELANRIKADLESKA